jgi:L-seryl-tRNA(Ser) seleniumtransferase
MIAAPLETLRQRAQTWADFLRQGEVTPGLSKIGGGSLPGETLPTFLLVLQAPSPIRVMEQLRGNIPPIIARLEDNHLVFDPRTVLPEEESSLLQGISQIMADARSSIKAETA